MPPIENESPQDWAALGGAERELLHGLSALRPTVPTLNERDALFAAGRAAGLQERQFQLRLWRVAAAVASICMAMVISIQSLMANYRIRVVRVEVPTPTAPLPPVRSIVSPVARETFERSPALESPRRRESIASLQEAVFRGGLDALPISRLRRAAVVRAGDAALQ